MRITAELIEASGCHKLAACGHRQLTLRGLKIPQIENLGASNDLYGALDLSENQIIRLERLPPLPQLRVLFMSNNRVERIDDDVFSYSLPFLESLVLTNNALTRLEHLSPLRHATHLQRLSLLNNPVQRHLKLPSETETLELLKSRADVTVASDLYLLYIIHLIPSLRFLDFQRITQKDRQRSQALFRRNEGETLFELVMRQQPKH